MPRSPRTGLSPWGGYRVSVSDERQRNRENWPRPEGLRATPSTPVVGTGLRPTGETVQARDAKLGVCKRGRSPSMSAMPICVNRESEVRRAYIRTNPSSSCASNAEQVTADK